MIISVVGCAPSSKDWFNTPCDISIGCNDAGKFGKDFDYLVVINSRQSFSKEPERMKVIESSKAKVLTNDDTWRGLDYKRVRLLSFHKTVKKGTVYCSKSSPFVAISYAFNLGATEILVWGADYNDHPLFNKKDPRSRDYELRKLESFCGLLKEQGTQVYSTNTESALSNFLPLWTK